MPSTELTYRSIAERVRSMATPAQTMQHVVDLLWDGLHDQDVSWLGFYLDQPEEPDDRRLVLGAHRDKPACSPIGLNGVCGDALLRRTTVIVDDVLTLGDAYIACDPRDRSELVMPLFDGSTCWGVLDVDSYLPGRFGAVDQLGFEDVLRAAGFTPGE